MFGMLDSFWLLTAPYSSRRGTASQRSTFFYFLRSTLVFHSFIFFASYPIPGLPFNFNASESILGDLAGCLEQGRPFIAAN
jgi:hypothetical protein